MSTYDTVPLINNTYKYLTHPKSVHHFETMKLLFLTTLLLATVTALQIYPKDKDNDAPLAPLISSSDAEIIPDKYIVVFKTDITADKISCHHNHINDLLFDERKKFKRGFMNELISGIEHVYNLDGFQGYSGRFSADVLNNIRQSDDVSTITMMVMTPDIIQ